MIHFAMVYIARPLPLSLSLFSGENTAFHGSYSFDLQKGRKDLLPLDTPLNRHFSLRTLVIAYGLLSGSQPLNDINRFATGLLTALFIFRWRLLHFNLQKL